MILEKMKSDLMSARRNKDRKTLSVLTTIIGEIETKSKIEKVDDAKIISMIKKVISNNEDTIKLSPSNTESFLFENQLLSDYLPKQLSEEELRNEILKIGSTQIQIVMKGLEEKFSGQYDRGLAAKIVKSL